jgi:hypothetical protein
MTYDIPGTVNSSLHLAPSPGNIKAGFQVSGIYPFNTDTSHDEEFMGAYVTGRSNLLWLQQLPTVTVNSQRRRLILHLHLLQEKKHILLPQRTFDLFLKMDTERVRM